MQALSTAQHLPQLRILNISNFLVYLERNDISAAGMTMMPDSKLSQLRELRLSMIFVTQLKITSAVWG